MAEQPDGFSLIRRNSGLETEKSSFESPRPVPIFHFREQTFSTKKERQTPRARPPPTPRPRTVHKSFTPVSHSSANGPQSISFVETRSRLSTKHYDHKVKKLYFNQCFEVISKLGTGSFGEVYKVICKEDRHYYAVKRSKEKFKGKYDRMRKLEEVKKHEELPQHPHCVQFFKAWEERDYLYIQTELCKTSLSQYSETNHDIPETTIWNFLIDLLLAVKHLHDHDLIHLDIKPENIFISENNICKLGDFGLVLDVKKGDVNDALEGDPKYLAPELMVGVFTKAADIFSLGITILELACDLDLPRGDTTWHLLRQNQIPPEITKRLSPSLTEIICKMMESDPMKRPTVDEILNLEAVRKAHKRRLQMLKFKSMLSHVTCIYQWALVFCCWVRSLLNKALPYLRKKEEKVTTPTRSEQQSFSPLCDYSFSDDDVFESEDSPDNLHRVCSDLFKDDIRPFNKCNDEALKKSSINHIYRNKCFTAPPLFICPWDDPLQRSPDSSPTVHKRSSSRSIRRSPRLAAKTDSRESSLVTIAPRNLLAEFEKQAANDAE